MRLPIPCTLRFGLSALLCAAPVLAQAQSLLDMVENATGYDAQWRAVQAEKEAAERRSEQARAPLLPQVGVGADLSRAQTRVHPQGLQHTGTTHSVALIASQSLYRPADKLQLAQSKLAVESAQYALNAAAQDLIVRVSQAYFDVLAAQDTLAFVQAQKAAVNEQLAAAERNFEVGNATITDTREAQARFDLIRAQEIASANDLQVKKLALDQTVGLIQSQPWPLKLPAALPHPASDNVLDWVSWAQEQQPQVRQAKLALDIAKLETDKAETGHLPTVSLNARVGQTNNRDGTISSPIPGMRSREASVGVELNMPLFAGGAVQNRIRETLALEEKARAQLDQVNRGATQATREAFYGLQSGQSQVKALEAAEASSQSALEANQLGYQVGVRINIDVLNAQSQLFQTRRDLAQARYTVLMSHLRLAQASGTLGMDEVRTINALLAPQGATLANTTSVADAPVVSSAP
ncbi:channel protein TolC [Lampropedia puyangensis]|uniref:Channel protein TolC n=1 Tax=Lampropedia puyangensis TaxID=1330072 RepID=A0A4S8F398_9BURK|nr:TolC family outer membrane protein [Lampropedia puyangensis]THU00604.1 channel protein TolC [Lampropedia puyangensis]